MFEHFMFPPRLVESFSHHIDCDVVTETPVTSKGVSADFWLFVHIHASCDTSLTLPSGFQ